MMCQMCAVYLDAEDSLVWFGPSSGLQVALVVKNPPANAGDKRGMDSIPELGRSLGEKHDNPLQFSCLENPMDRKPGGLLSIVPQRVGHNWGDSMHTLAYSAAQILKLWLRKEFSEHAVRRSNYLKGIGGSYYDSKYKWNWKRKKYLLENRDKWGCCYCCC